ncbi:MAG: B12-binding domain-containing radical SAM protein, partial [Candidatus Hermodarchaeota archaeon]
VLEMHDVSCRIVRAEEVVTTPRRLRDYEHVAISAMTMDIPVTQSIIKKWRHTNPSGRVLVGGPIGSDPINALGELKPDLLVVGEGEGTLNNLLVAGYLDEKVDCCDMQGVAYLVGKRPVVNAPRPPLTATELSEVFVPSTTRIVDYRAYQAARVYVEAVRGCSNFGRTNLRLPDGRECSDCGNCDSDIPADRLDCPEDIPAGCGFCSVPQSWGPPRSRSPDSIVAEIKGLLDLGVHKIVLEAPDFLDYHRGSDPLTNPCEPEANIDAISDLLRQITSLPRLVEGRTRVSVENVKACLFTDEVASALSRSMKGISPNIGVESGSDDHLRRIGKCGSTGDVLRAVKVAANHGMAPFVYLIYGLPGETPETIQESISLMKAVAEAGAERIILYGFRALPGSAFSDFYEPSPKNPLYAELKQEAAKINRAKKKEYLGKTVLGIAAEPSWERHGYTMFYPLDEGPLITVRGGFSSGTLLPIQIKKVLSSGLVEGIVHAETAEE